MHDEGMVACAEELKNQVCSAALIVPATLVCILAFHVI
jgi:hypothetical protein